MESAPGEPSTQLADVRPQIDYPIRVLIPASFNAPNRAERKCRDDYIKANAFSPKAFSGMKKVLEPSVLSKRVVSLVGGGSEQDAKLSNAIRDFTVVAFSSHRAGKKDVEAGAYVSIAVTQDNLGNYQQAIDSYKQYYSICKDIKDRGAEAVACNCIGVNYMFLASPVSDAGIIKGMFDTSTAREHLNKAIEYHTLHLGLADSGGKFVAHTNLGLCYSMLGEVANAAKHHQDALRIAIRMQTLYGQSIAVGNLGILAMMKSDTSTARTCFQQHLQLAQTLQDTEAEVNAWKLLAQICTIEESFAEALDNLEQARRVATKEGYMNELKRILCLMGFAKGSMEFAAHSEQLVGEVTALSQMHSS